MVAIGSQEETMVAISSQGEMMVVLENIPVEAEISCDQED